MRPLTDLLWHKDPLTLEDAATLLSGGKRGSNDCREAEGILAAAIVGGKLQADVVRWPVYDWMNHEIGGGKISEYETTIFMDDFKTYCHYIGLNIGAEAVPAGKVGAVTGTSPSGDDWTEKARHIADKLALERYKRGEREITARNISDAVATELTKDSTTHGIRGERSAGNIRNIALKGWKFIPPTGTNGTSGTNK